MAGIPSVDTCFILTALQNGNRYFLHKTGREGSGPWRVTRLWEYAQKLPTLTRAKQILMSAQITKLSKFYDIKLRVLEVEATYKTKKVWPLSPLEALARVAPEYK